MPTCIQRLHLLAVLVVAAAPSATRADVATPAPAWVEPCAASLRKTIAALARHTPALATARVEANVRRSMTRFPDGKWIENASWTVELVDAPIAVSVAENRRVTGSSDGWSKGRARDSCRSHSRSDEDSGCTEEIFSRGVPGHAAMIRPLRVANRPLVPAFEKALDGCLAIIVAH